MSVGFVFNDDEYEEEETMIGFGGFTEITPEKQKEEELRALRYDVVNWLVHTTNNTSESYDIVDDVLIDAELIVRYIYDGVPEGFDIEDSDDNA